MIDVHPRCGNRPGLCLSLSVSWWRLMVKMACQVPRGHSQLTAVEENRHLVDSLSFLLWTGLGPPPGNKIILLHPTNRQMRNQLWKILIISHLKSLHRLCEDFAVVCWLEFVSASQPGDLHPSLASLRQKILSILFLKHLIYSKLLSLNTIKALFHISL